MRSVVFVSRPHTWEPELSELQLWEFFFLDVMWLVVCVWSHVIGGLFAYCLLPSYQIVVSYW